MPTPWSLHFPLRDLAKGKEPQLQPHLLLKHTHRCPVEFKSCSPKLLSNKTHLREAIAVLTKRDPHGRFNDQTFCKDIKTTDVNFATKGPLGTVGSERRHSMNSCPQRPEIKMLLTAASVATTSNTESHGTIPDNSYTHLIYCTQGNSDTHFSFIFGIK